MSRNLVNKTMHFLNRVYSEKSGNVSVMFCGTIFTVMAAIGFAVDYTGMQSEQTRLQNQVDAAVLAVVLSGESDKDKQILVAHAAMMENGYPADYPKPVISLADDGSITVKAASLYDVTIMGMFGEKQKMVEADASSMLAQNDVVELALVLDTTASMGRDGKIEALRSATNDLITSVSSTPEGSIKIALIPYANYVNVDSVGMNNRSASWTDVPADWSEMVTVTDRVKTANGFCRGTYTGTHTYVEDGVKVTKYDQCTDWVRSEYLETGSRQEEKTYGWKGCVTSRMSGMHMEDGSYMTPVPGILSTSCSDPIVPLTDDFTRLKTAVSNLSVGKNTYMPAGLIWGQRVLSAGAPYAETGVSSSDVDVRQMMVLMTDGMNSMALNTDGTHSELNIVDNPADAVRVDQTNMDTAQLCANIKADGVEIYTIAFAVTDVQTKQMLTNCASSTQHYFRAESASQLSGVFNAISTRIFAVRITQ